LAELNLPGAVGTKNPECPVANVGFDEGKWGISDRIGILGIADHCDIDLR
jgi:hypothetical protein